MPSPLSRMVACRFVASAVFAVSVHAGPPAPASTRNPLTPILASSADANSPDIKTEPDASPSTATTTSNPTPDHLANVHAGDFALYRALDFDSGVAALRATVAGPRAGTLELHLDSPTSPLLASCPFASTGGWDHWQDITANVDHSLAGVRDVYVLFRAPANEPPDGHALVNLRGFVFLKSVVTPTTGAPDLASRLDSPDDHAPQGIHAWGIPETGFVENFNGEHWRENARAT